VARTAAILLLLATTKLAVALGCGIRSEWQAFRSPASTLAAAHSLHLPPEQEMRYDFLVANVKRNCRLLFSIPGMGSLNLWSGVPAPNGWNVGAWMRVFDLEHQHRIVEILRAERLSCVVEDTSMLGFWQVNVICPHDVIQVQ
jgi:hypothetical protein